MIAVLVTVFIFGLIAFMVYKYASTILVRRLEDDQVVARFKTRWEAEQYVDNHLEDRLYIWACVDC